MGKCKGRHGECFIHTHTKGSYTNSGLVADGETVYEFFEDTSRNHNKTMVSLWASYTVGTSAVYAILERRGGDTIYKLLPSNYVLVVQVEDLCRVSFKGVPVQAGSDATDVVFPTYTASIEFDKTFCICCPGNDGDSGSCCSDCVYRYSD